MLNMNEVRRIVVKVGSSTLTYDNGKPNIRRIERLVRTISDLQNRGFEMVLVSSGAVAVGTAKLGLAERPKELSVKQAAAARRRLRPHARWHWQRSRWRMITSRPSLPPKPLRQNAVPSKPSLPHCATGRRRITASTRITTANEE